jgi:hypothetical protein
MQASTAIAIVASIYVLVSLAFGYVAVILGEKLGGRGQRRIDAVAGDDRRATIRCCT